VATVIAIDPRKTLCKGLLGGEMLGRTIAETVVSNRAMLVMRAGGIAKLIRFVFLVPRVDPERIAEATLRLLADAESHLARDGRSMAHEAFDLKRNVGALLEIDRCIRPLLHAPAGPSR
jgi:hypothetical protein